MMRLLAGCRLAAKAAESLFTDLPVGGWPSLNGRTTFLHLAKANRKADYGLITNPVKNLAVLTELPGAI
jgi:hypothetical protein